MASKAKQRNFVLDALALCIITLVAGALLGFVYELTKDVIAESEVGEKLAAYEAVFPDAEFKENEAFADKLASQEYADALAAAGVEKASVLEAYEAVDASGNVAGYVMLTQSTAGYEGEVGISVGMLPDGTVCGIEFVTLNETQGVGSRAAEPDFKDQYVNQGSEGFTLGGNINGMAGATVTSKAVTNAMNAAVVFVQQFAQN